MRDLKIQMMLLSFNAYVTVQRLWIDSQVVGRCLAAYEAILEESDAIRYLEGCFYLLLDE